MTIPDQYEQTGLVFAGTVKSIKPSTDGLNLIVKFKVFKVWRGKRYFSYKVRGIKTCDNETCCGYKFEQGKKYIIFADKDGNGFFFTNTCSLTQPYTLNYKRTINSLSRYYDLF
jgi:hypothetical protein